MVAIPVKKTTNIPDGEHVGVITNIRYRSRPYDYVDLEIEFPIEEEKVKIRCGYPQLITANSKLGQLLQRFGERLIEGVSIDPDPILIGKPVRFRTKTETTSRGSFAKVEDSSVRPAGKLHDH